MSEVLAQLEKKGGGDLKETTLWTNSAPTSNFNSQTITLSESITSDDTIRIYYRVTTANADSMYLDIPFSNFTSSSNQGLYSTVQVGSSLRGYCRPFRWLTANQITFDPAYQLNAASSSVSYIIPTKISKLS